MIIHKTKLSIVNDLDLYTNESMLKGIHINLMDTRLFC